jgi:excisionase family DNA binding protein
MRNATRYNKMMTTSGVASMLHLHINTVRRWADQGILKGYRIGPRGDRRFKKDEIEFLLYSNHFGYKD